MSAEGKNFESITKARDQHNATCEFPAHTVCLHPIELERMQWEEGDRIAGLVVKSDSTQGTGSFLLLCDRDQKEPEVETTEAVAEDRDLVKV